MGSSVEHPNLEHMKTCLKEAGLYEENMRNKDVIEYYSVIKTSQDLAVREDQQRKESEKPVEQVSEVVSSSTVKEKQFKPRSWSQNETIDEALKHLSDDENSNDNFLSDKINVLDSVPTKHKLLTIVHHDLNCNLPPYCDPNLNKLSVKNRAKLILEYHEKLLKQIQETQRKSIFHAAWGKPIVPLDEGQNNDCDGVNYVSRSGRLVKRKLYTEEDSSDEDNNIKRHKLLPISKLKRNSPNDENKQAKSTSKEKKFYKTNSSLSKSTRSEKMFDQLVEDEKSKKAAETEMRRFEDSLMHLSEDDDEETQAIIENHESNVQTASSKKETFSKKIIIPPLPGKRKQIILPVSVDDSTKKLKNQTEPDETIEITSDTVTSSVLKTPKSTSLPIQIEKTNCPLCNKEFSQDDIVMHASTCGLNDSDVVEIIESGDSSDRDTRNTIICEICDKVLELNTDYEVHVKDCLKEIKMKKV